MNLRGVTILQIHGLIFIFSVTLIWFNLANILSTGSYAFVRLMDLNL